MVVFRKPEANAMKAQPLDLFGSVDDISAVISLLNAGVNGNISTSITASPKGYRVRIGEMGQGSALFASEALENARQNMAQRIELLEKRSRSTS